LGLHPGKIPPGSIGRGKTRGFGLEFQGMKSNAFKLDPTRLLDADDHGRSGHSGEILIVGQIYPDEIKAVKIRNDDAHSELLLGHYIKQLPEKNDPNREVKDPGNWRSVRP
jgi:hypothetical protein